MSFSVIIPCKDEAGTVDRLLESLTQQTALDLVQQVIVVDSHSTDDTVKRALSFAKQLPIHIVTAKKKGVTHARNEGAAQTAGDMLLFIDADATLPENFIADLAVFIEKGSVDAGGTSLRMPSRDRSISFGARCMNGYARLMQHTPWPIAFGSGLFINKKAFNELGGFDPALYIMEDYDIVLRAKRAGYTVRYAPVFHYASDRRFIADKTSGLRGFYGELYRYTHGLRVTKPIYKYQMGGQKKDKSTP